MIPYLLHQAKLRVDSSMMQRTRTFTSQKASLLSLKFMRTFLSTRNRASNGCTPSSETLKEVSSEMIWVLEKLFRSART